MRHPCVMTLLQLLVGIAFLFVPRGFFAMVVGHDSLLLIFCSLMSVSFHPALMLLMTALITLKRLGTLILRCLVTLNHVLASVEVERCCFVLVLPSLVIGLPILVVRMHAVKGNNLLSHVNYS